MSLERVARRARVSTSTVSRVLNNTGPVKSSTRARVLKAIAAFKYSPNLHARSLAGGESRSIGVRAAVDKQYFPDQLTVVPHDGETVTVADEPLTWHAVDTTNYNVNLYHFAYALNKPTSNVLFWAVTRVEVPQEMRNVRLAIGSNAASIWWLNGEEVIGIYGDRQTVIDDGVSKRLTLTKGLNTIRVAVINAGGATDFCARFLDADDAPVRGIRVRLGPE